MDRFVTRRMDASAFPRRSITSTSILACFAFALVVLVTSLVSKRVVPTASIGNSSNYVQEYKGPRVPVFSYYSDHAAARKLRQDLEKSSVVDYIVLNTQQQESFLRSKPCAGGAAVERFQQLVASGLPHVAHELWKYCALVQYGGMYLDAESPLVDTLDHVIAKPHKNVAVLNDPSFPRSIHGSFLLLREPQSKVAKGMIEVLMTTPVDVLDASPLLMPQTLYDLIATEASSGSLYPGASGNDWFLLQHRCFVDPLLRSHVSAAITSHGINSYRPFQFCPEPNGFCCSVSDTVDQTAMMMTRHILLPYQLIPHTSKLPKPYNAEAGHYDAEDLPYISTLREKTNPRPDEPLLTPNVFETLLQNDCLPSDKKCSDCLRNKRGADCHTCQRDCPCYCKTMCHIPVEEKFISKELTVTPPVYSRDPSRLVPRIVHQTWFEDVSKEKYPNMSRLIESFKNSGWEYKFYTDDEAGNFLSTHFPPEVREAYDALIPGAFKADLFRYCVLLIHGGVYADMDIMLESNLDVAVGPDVGFMVPQDEPGTPIDKRMCLWNGFIAAAPGHPFLAKVVETVVNNVRNRFTSVDNDNMFCPDPELSILHAFDTLFTAGPCILGSMLNKVLGRHLQTSFQAGEIDHWEPKTRLAANQGTSFVKGLDEKPTLRIPGRTIILRQNKWDMGAHRFTLVEKNLVVAGTDLPDSDDRENLEKPKEHYSNTHVKAGIYGRDKLYVDNVRANEEIRLYINAHAALQRQSVM